VETEFFVESLSWIFFGLVNINNTPFLLDRVVSGSHIGLKAFDSFTSCINGVAILFVKNLFILVFELAPPVCEFGVDVMSFSDEVSISSIASVLEYLVTVGISSDKSFSFAVELPFLSSLSISCLSHSLVSIMIYCLKISLISLGDNEEISIAIESISWMVFTCLVVLLVLDVSDIPSL
jgi:hypothetical protein